MNPTLSLPWADASGTFAPAARAAAAAATMSIFRMSVSAFSDGRFELSGSARPVHAHSGGLQRSGTKTRPSDAGAADLTVPRAPEITTSTTTVARYGKDDISWEGMPKPAPCAGREPSWDGERADRRK